MMNEAKPFASLGPTLLARKGGARPAMRPQLSPLLSGGQATLDEDHDELDDLGWNDMGHPDEDEREARVIPIGLSPIGASDDDEADVDDEEFDDEPAPAVHALRDEELEEESVATGNEFPDEEFESEPVPAAYALLHDEPEDEPVPAVRAFPDEESEDESDYADLPEESLREQEYASPSMDPQPEAVPEAKVEPEILHQRYSLPASAGAEPRRARRNAIDDGRRAAFTLRLDAQRHLKLRLASTIRNRSAQQLVTEALDRFLADVPEIEALAARVTRD